MARGARDVKAADSDASSDSDDSEDATLNDGEKRAGHQPRHCTDVVCIPVFLGCFGVLGFILHFASINGEMARVFHGIDFQNQICGFSPAVEEKPFLFWCTEPGSSKIGDIASQITPSITQPSLPTLPTDLSTGQAASAAVSAYSGSLDLAHPICVQKCPDSTKTHHSCFQSEVVSDGQRQPDGTFMRNTTFIYDLVQDYPAIGIAKRYCLPRSEVLLEQLKAIFGDGVEGVMFHIAGVFEHWPVLAASAFQAVLLGYIYLFLLNMLARPLLILSVILATLVPLGVGFVMIKGLVTESEEQMFAAHLGNQSLFVDFSNVSSTVSEGVQNFVPSTGNEAADIAIACLLIIVGIAVPVLFCLMKRSIDMVLATMKATMGCMKDLPMLLLVPAFMVIFKLLYLALAFTGLALVVSVGDVKTMNLGESVPSGIMRTFDHSEEERLYVFGYIFIAFWLFEFLSALEQFMYIYATQMWFFAPLSTSVIGMRTKSVSQFWPFRGILLGLTFHLGSLAFGSLILAIFQVLYIVLSLVFRQAKTASDGNAAVRGVAACCLCCLKCWETIIRYLNKMVYIVVSMNSENFCTAARTMLSVVSEEFVALGLLEGAAKVMNICGVISIGAAGGGLTWILLRNLGIFNDPESEHFVLQPEYVTIASSIVSLIVGSVFMSVFDVVSDALLFVFALDTRNRRKNGLPPNDQLPPSLRALVKNR